MLVTEKVGYLRFVGADGKLSPQAVGGLPAVDNRGQGGLLDVVLDPNFATNGLIYWSYAEPRENGTNNTAVARGKFVEGPPARVENAQVIYHQGPSLTSTAHYGSRLIFAPRRHAVHHARRALDHRRAHAGAADGRHARQGRRASTPTARSRKDNPFVGQAGVRPEIFSIGHRNIQSAALHPTTGELWEVEHGTRGGDEINIVRKGKDYGWPTIAYGIEYAAARSPATSPPKDGMEQPIYYWDPVIGPSGMAFYTGRSVPGVEGQPLHRRAPDQRPGARCRSTARR